MLRLHIKARGAQMSKSIRVSDQVYGELQKRRLAFLRETFSEVISELLVLAELLERAEPIIRGQHAFLEWQKEQNKKGGIE